MSILVIDVGTSSVRGSIVEADGTISHRHNRSVGVLRPSPGLVEVDPNAIAKAVLSVARAALGDARAVDSIGISAQRASTVLWERASGVPVGPGIAWQDIRTIGQCLALQAQGIRLAPNQSATKLSWMLANYDYGDATDLCFGTIESFVAYVLSRGEVHVTDVSNAAVTGLLLPDASDWDLEVISALSIPESVLPVLVDSMGDIGEAVALKGAPPIRGLVGDQQASMIGQACLSAGDAKATFGTGAMLDCAVGTTRPEIEVRGEQGTFPIVVWRAELSLNWGLEAIMLSAGTCVEWLCSGLGLIKKPADSASVAAAATDAGGVSFVPSLGGMGTPKWDFGARGCLVGLDATTTAAQIVRAVLDGIAQRGADLLEAVEQDAKTSIEVIRLDGGMSNNPVFVQLLANATGRPVDLAATTEATTLGAAFLAGTASGVWSTLNEAASSVIPRGRIEPVARVDRERWLDARERALRQVPALSTLAF